MPVVESAPAGAIAPGPQTEIPWHAREAGEVLTALDASLHGLTADEARARKARFGANRLAAARQRSEILRFLAQFNNLLIYVLLGAAVLAILIGHMVDAAVILAVVLLNAIIGFVQEGRAEKALDAIRGMIDPRATVLRGGRRTAVPADDIVPGDLVIARVRRPCAGRSPPDPGAQPAASTKRR